MTKLEKEIRACLDGTYEGVLFGEYQGVHCSQLYLEQYPQDEQKLFKLLKDVFMDMLDTTNIHDFFKAFWELESAVSYYEFKGNEQGLELMEELLKWVLEKEKEYEVVVSLEWTNYTHAESEEHAIRLVKSSFKEQYGIELDDIEIKAVELLEEEK